MMQADHPFKVNGWSVSFLELAFYFGCPGINAFDGIGVLYEDLKNSGCTFLGNKVSTDGYSFSSSIAVVDGAFVGLPLDEVNESNKTASPSGLLLRSLVRIRA